MNRAVALFLCVLAAGAAQGAHADVIYPLPGVPEGCDPWDVGDVCEPVDCDRRGGEILPDRCGPAGWRDCDIEPWPCPNPSRFDPVIDERLDIDLKP